MVLSDHGTFDASSLICRETLQIRARLSGFRLEPAPKCLNLFLFFQPGMLFASLLHEKKNGGGETARS